MINTINQNIEIDQKILKEIKECEYIWNVKLLNITYFILIIIILDTKKIN